MGPLLVAHSPSSPGSSSPSVVREDAHSCQCTGHLKQLGLALLNYESAYGCLPPAYVADAHGKPLYSWRVVLMAYLEREENWDDRPLSKAFRFDEAWDGPNNRRLRDMRPPSLFCPSHPESAENGFTSYVAVVGPRTLFPSTGKSRKLTEIRDDPQSTLMLVESESAGVHWMEPRDLDWDTMSFRVNDRSRPSISSEHRVGSYPGPHVVTANDGVGYLPDGVSPDTVRSLLTIDDGRAVHFNAGPQKR